MIKLRSASTQELDDPETAVREILEQLDMKNQLLKNKAALLFCHVRFIETGIAEAVYKNLPFDVLGCTSLYFGLPESMGKSAPADKPVQAGLPEPMSKSAPAIEGEIVLTVAVLTSDDMEFTTGVSKPLNEENVEECVLDLYQSAAASPGEPPSLVFAFLPTMTNLPGDVMSAALDRVCGGIPIFGSVALDMNVHIQQPKTIFRGSGESGAFSDRIAALFFRCPIKPRFFHSSFPETSILPWDAVITEVAGNRIISINNKPALSFIKGLGIVQNDIQERIMVYPLVVEYPDNDINVIVLQDISQEGHLICSRNVQAGGILNIGAITSDSVLEGAKRMAQSLKNSGSGACFLMFSCFLRNVVLGGNSLAEFELVQREMYGYQAPWLFLNSGGELCPLCTENGETVNQFHQFALIACQF